MSQIFPAGGLLSDVLARVAGVEHEFGGLDLPWNPERFPTWEKRKPRWKQVHGVAAAEATIAGECGEVDALYTFASGSPIAVVTADCVPVLLARRDGAAVAAVHAGWRGTRAGILRALWQKLSARGERPADWVAAVGPSIGPCCYEVSEELAADFARDFGWVGAAGDGETGAVPRHRHLDLPAINAAELQRLGFAEVDLLRACTKCSVNAEGGSKFHSYRREGGGTRQFSMIEKVRK
jgi:YfiH family protein